VCDGWDQLHTYMSVKKSLFFRHKRKNCTGFVFDLGCIKYVEPPHFGDVVDKASAGGVPNVFMN
jgi:hypothetical protein